MHWLIVPKQHYYYVALFVVCKKAIDLGFIMDASSSVRRSNYNKVKSFIKDLSDDFTIGASDTRFGIIHYSDSARLDFTQRDSKYV